MSNKFHKSLKKRIFQSEWHTTRPMGIISASDSYYLGLSNKILAIIESLSISDIFTEKSKRDISIKTTAYFEDVISGFGLWQAFINIHKELYGKYLPFFDLDDEEYFDDEINVEDIQFLVWAVLQRDDIENEIQRFLNPENPSLISLSEMIYDLLDDEFETAPENEKVCNYIHTVNHLDDILSTRDLLGWLHYNSYLSMSYPLQNFQREIEDLKLKKTDDFYRDNFDRLKYAIEKSAIFSKTCTPLAIHAKDWLAQIVAGTPKAKVYKAIDFRQINNYNIVAYNAETVTISNADNQNFQVSINSLSNPPSFIKEKSMMCSIVFFNGLWRVNGFASFFHEKAEFRKIEEFNDPASKRKAYEQIMNITDKPICYCKNSQELVEVLMQIFPASDKNKLLPDGFDELSNFVIFAHPEIGIGFFPDLAQHITDPNNPLFDKIINEQEGLGVLTGYYELPKQLLEYLIDNDLINEIHLNSLFGKEYGRNQIQDNLRFIVRFFQPNLFF